MTSEQGKAREFDLYISEDGYGDHICETDAKWSDGSDYAKPSVHVIEYSAYLAEKERADRLEKALNKIGILSMSGAAHTREFTEKVETLCRDALDVKKKFPY